MVLVPPDLRTILGEPRRGSGEAGPVFSRVTSAGRGRRVASGYGCESSNSLHQVDSFLSQYRVSVDL